MGLSVLRLCGRRAAAAVPPAALLAVAVLVLAAAGPDGAEGSRTYRLCGRHLADILDLICKGRGFHDPFANAEPGKRAVVYSQSGRGVSDECCRQGCTRRTMESYCSAEIEPKHPAPERPEPMGDLRHPHRNGVHPESLGREAAEDGAASSAAAKASASTDASEDSSSSSKVTTTSRGGGDGGGGHSGGGGVRAGRRRKGKGERRRRRGGGGRPREGGDSEERGRRGGKAAAAGRKCRCKRRRRKTDAEATKRQLTHGSFQIGTIAPSFLGTPVILPRGKFPNAFS